MAESTSWTKTLRPLVPFEPLFRATPSMNPEFHFDDVDVVVNRNSLRKLLDFCVGRSDTQNNPAREPTDKASPEYRRGGPRRRVAGSKGGRPFHLPGSEPPSMYYVIASAAHVFVCAPCLSPAPSAPSGGRSVATPSEFPYLPHLV